MNQEIHFVYTYQITLPEGEVLEGGSSLELETEGEETLELVEAYTIAYEAVLEEIAELLGENYQAGETEVTISIQKLTIV